MPGSDELDLRKNAYDFLNESIRNAERAAEEDPAIWKFAIVNLAQAIELLLKERLRLEHRLLVYTDIDRRRQTVGVDQALARLESCGVTFDPEDIARIKRARDIRNNIVHYDISINETQLRAAYTDFFEFIHFLHIDAFNEEIHKHIEEDLWVPEAALIEEFRREFIQYQGATLHKTFPSQILDSQFILSYLIEGNSYKRLRWQKPPGWPSPDCGDCGVLPGQLHATGCDLEICPRCGLQWLSCGCGDAAEFEYAQHIDTWIIGPASHDPATSPQAESAVKGDALADESPENLEVDGPGHETDTSPQ